MSATATRVMNELVDQLIEQIKRNRNADTIRATASTLTMQEQPLTAEAKARLLDVVKMFFYDRGHGDLLYNAHYRSGMFSYVKEVIESCEMLGVVQIFRSDSASWKGDACYHTEFVPTLLEHARVTDLVIELEKDDEDREVFDIVVTENDVVFYDNQIDGELLWLPSNVYGYASAETTVQRTPDGLLFTGVRIGGVFSHELGCVEPVFNVLVNEETGAAQIVEDAFVA